jgi:hypothetical protein
MPISGFDLLKCRDIPEFANFGILTWPMGYGKAIDKRMLSKILKANTYCSVKAIKHFIHTLSRIDSKHFIEKTSSPVSVHLITSLLSYLFAIYQVSINKLTNIFLAGSVMSENSKSRDLSAFKQQTYSA